MFSDGNTLTLIVCIILHLRTSHSLEYHVRGGYSIYTRSCLCTEVYGPIHYDDVEELICTISFASNHNDDEESPCSSSPCLNNGACFVGPRSRACVCPGDFSGTDCEIDDTRFHPDNVSQNFVLLGDLVGNYTDRCDVYGNSEVEYVNFAAAIAMTNKLCRNDTEVGTSIVTASAVNITVSFCKYEESTVLLSDYHTYCPETFDQHFCLNQALATPAITTATSTMTPAITTATSTTGADTRAEKILAASIAVASIIVFIIAIGLVLLCCRRMSYRMNLKRGKQNNTPSTVIENSAYISVDNGVAASTNNIPVYAKPDKGNRQPANGATSSGYEKHPVTKPRDSGYEEATISPIRHLVDDDISNKPPATPPRPRSAARMSTPADGYEEANLPSNKGNKSPGMTNNSSGYEDNFVKPDGSSGYEDNFVTPQKGTKESIKYDHLNRKVNLDGREGLM